MIENGGGVSGNGFSVKVKYNGCVRGRSASPRWGTVGRGMGKTRERPLSTAWTTAVIN